MFRSKLFLILFFVFSIGFSQNEANNWFFGSRVGLQFNGAGKPTPITGSLNTLEGCASISDSSGNLLFYSDGSSVWSRNHQIMPNGTDLLGDESSSQSAIIVPNPSNPDIYYLFTVGSTITPSGYHYYTIDLSLNNGLGDVAAGPVNLAGTGGHDGEFWSEKITAVETDTCDSYWVISLVGNTYYVYKVDANGVSNTPIRSRVDFGAGQSRGYLKISPDGTKLAAAHQGESMQTSGLILYSFNKTNGAVANDGRVLYQPGGADAPYGIEFSPSGRMLYASIIEGRKYSLIQYDLEDANIQTYATLIHKENNAFRGALQLGPDQKIYVTIPEEYTKGTHYLDVINNPEQKGLACNFEEDYIDFGTEFSMQGLPPFIQSFFIIDEINIVNPFQPVTETSHELEICVGDTYTLEGTEIVGANYFWSFDDGNTVTNLPTPNPAHQLVINANGLNTEGTYHLLVETNDPCDTQLEGTASIMFTPQPNANLSVFLQGCDKFDTDATDGLTTFDLSQSIADITNNNPNNFDVYFYESNADADADLYNQNALPLLFTNTSSNQILTTKIYNTGGECYVLGTLELNAITSQVITPVNMLGCDKGDGTATFSLQNKEQEIISSIGTPGNYSVTFFNNLQDAINNANPLENNYTGSSQTLYFSVENNGNCFASGSFTAQVFTFPDFEPKETIIQCDNSFPVTIEAPINQNQSGNYSFYWSTGETSHNIIVASPQTVTVRVVHNVSQCETVKEFKLIGTRNPLIIDVDVNINNNSVTIITEENADNLYVLDDPFFGEYQTSNTFTNIPPGTYDVYVKNKYDCGITSKRIFILGFPKFFTPNSDGANDTWQLKGADYQNFSFSDINIFNRYGKHITTIKPNASWNGLYNGKLLPPSDYWFTINVTDSENLITHYQGHFSLVHK
jgi:gliding motility-associated-like protein